MKKIIFGLVLFFFVWCENVQASCRGLTSFFDFSKEHKICSEYAAGQNGDSFKKTDSYCDCRERLDNKKKYGLEKTLKELLP